MTQSIKSNTMKRSFNPVTSLFALLILLSGCELYYIPPHVQTPTHEKKGDLAANLQASYTFSGSASYAITDHIFIGGSYMGYSSETDSMTTDDYFRTTTLEGGYYNFDTVNNLHFEIMAGTGFGQVGDAGGFEVNFNRLYIQPGIAFLSDRRVVENHLNFRFATVQYQAQTNPQVNPFTVNYFEPSYTLRVGSPNVKFHVQFGLSVPVSSTSSRPTNYSQDPLFIGFGINAKLNVFEKINGL